MYLGTLDSYSENNHNLYIDYKGMAIMRRKIYHRNFHTDLTDYGYSEHISEPLYNFLLAQPRETDDYNSITLGDPDKPNRLVITDRIYEYGGVCLTRLHTSKHFLRLAPATLPVWYLAVRDFQVYIEFIDRIDFQRMKLFNEYLEKEPFGKIIALNYEDKI